MLQVHDHAALRLRWSIFVEPQCLPAPGGVRPHRHSVDFSGRRRRSSSVWRSVAPLVNLCRGISRSAAQQLKLRSSASSRVRAAGRDRSSSASLIRGQGPLRVAPQPRPIWDDKALRALARIGNNLNQIARELHRRERQGVSPDEITALDRALLQVITLTLSGPEAARQLFALGLSRVMAQVPVPPQHGPSAPTDVAPTQGP